MSCPSFEDLVDWWSASPDGEGDDALSLHVLSCDRCAELAGVVAELASSVRALGGGSIGTVYLTDSLANQLARSGARVRAYHLSPDQVVPCAIAADDEIVVTHLYVDPAELATVERVDVTAEVGGMPMDRRTDLPVNRRRGEVAFADSARAMRTVPGGTRITLRMLGISGDQERVLGEYVLAHEER